MPAAVPSLIENVAVHEAGHIFGLDYVSEETHGWLTMSRMGEGNCDMSQVTLGRGDMKGLQLYYP